MTHAHAEAVRSISNATVQMPDIAKYIEHTALKPDLKENDIAALCREAVSFGFYGVCIPPTHLRAAKESLKGTSVRLVTVIGFPLGYTYTESKLKEAELAIIEGADELDMVMNVSVLKSGYREIVKSDIGAIADQAHAHGKILKVILETPLLSVEEIKLACAISLDAGADIIKTCTGFAGGVTLETVKLLRSLVPTETGIKASGGIKTKAFAQELIEAGATRIGTSSGVQIIEG